MRKVALKNGLITNSKYLFHIHCAHGIGQDTIWDPCTKTDLETQKLDFLSSTDIQKMKTRV
jgi:hypothetical protein